MKKNVLKRIMAMGLSVLMVSGLSGCNGSGEKEFTLDGGNPDDLPQQITMMADTVVKPENGLADFCDQFKKQTGIGLSVEKPDHAKYYEKVTLSFASEEPADLIEMGSTYYPELANSGALWDMTEAWNNTTSNCKKIIDEKYVDALKINGTLYGFPMSAGNGTVTYVREDWLKDAGLSAPKNYDEFINMLRAFKERGGGAIPITAAGLLNTETPYDLYLREFYQDAVPDFYKDEKTGKYVDGFSQPAMKEAAQRLREAYQEGLLDAEVVTNKTSTCRDKLGSGLVGAFNYWAGKWGMKLDKSLSEGNMVAIPAIEETGGYTERVPTALAMSIYAPNKAAIFEHVLMYSHDGGEGQMLFTHGVKDIHYSVESDGTYKVKKQISDPKSDFEKALYDQELSITEWNDPFELDSRITDSISVYRQNRQFAEVPKVTDTISENLADLNVVKNVVIAKAVTDKEENALEEAFKYYEEKGGYYVKAILEDLNSDENLAEEAKAAKAAEGESSAEQTSSTQGS